MLLSFTNSIKTGFGNARLKDYLKPKVRIETLLSNLEDYTEVGPQVSDIRDGARPNLIKVAVRSLTKCVRPQCVCLAVSLDDVLSS